MPRILLTFPPNGTEILISPPTSLPGVRELCSAFRCCCPPPEVRDNPQSTGPCLPSSSRWSGRPPAVGAPLRPRCFPTESALYPLFLHIVARLSSARRGGVHPHSSKRGLSQVTGRPGLEHHVLPTNWILPSLRVWVCSPLSVRSGSLPGGSRR